MLRFVLPLLFAQSVSAAVPQTPPADAGAQTAAAPDVVLLSVSRAGTIDPWLDAEIVNTVRSTLAESGLIVQDPAKTRALIGNEKPETCVTNAICLALLGRVSGAAVVVRVEAAVVDTDLAIVLGAVAPIDAKTLAQRNFLSTTTGNWKVDVRRESLALAGQLHGKLPPRTRPEPIVTAPDTSVHPPPDTTTKPPPDAVTPPEPGVEAHAHPSRIGPLFWAPLAVGVASCAASAYFFQHASAIHDHLTTPPPTPADTLHGAQADALVQDGKTAQTIGSVTLGVGIAGLAVAGGSLLFSSPGDEEATTVSVVPTEGGAFVSVGARWP